MPKVAVTDFTFASLDLERAVLEPLGCRFEAAQCTTPEQLVPLVRDADVVITQFAPLTGPVVGAMARCRAIVRYGIGVDNVDLEAAAARGIPVCNVPDYCIDEVADHTLGLILALTRQLLPIAATVRRGSWNAFLPPEQMRALREMTVGVVGFGRIGREVVRRLTAFKCRLQVFDPVVAASEVEAAGALPAPLDVVLETSDLVTLHCPSTPETRYLLNRDRFARMKEGVLIVNAGRGTLIRTEDLVEALRTRRVGGAALDVVDPEPLPAGHPLLTMDNAIITNHVASCSATAINTLRTTVARTAAAALRGEPLPHVVNGVRR
jgi:D-3-phosphoglycerate dehydrogenase